MSDIINHPKHYTTGKFEVIDIIKDKLTAEQFEGYLVGNVMKYIMRYRHKNGVEDLEKAVWYLSKLINELEPKKDYDCDNCGNKGDKEYCERCTTARIPGAIPPEWEPIYTAKEG